MTYEQCDSCRFLNGLDYPEGMIWWCEAVDDDNRDLMEEFKDRSCPYFKEAEE